MLYSIILTTYKEIEHMNIPFMKSKKILKGMFCVFNDHVTLSCD